VKTRWICHRATLSFLSWIASRNTPTMLSLLSRAELPTSLRMALAGLVSRPGKTELTWRDISALGTDIRINSVSIIC
jgi:hypothetical protein